MMMLTFLRRLPNAARPVARRNLSFAISGNLEKLPAAGLKKEATYFHARLQSTLTQDGTDEDANNNRYTQLENYIQGRKREVVQVTETLLKVIASGDYETYTKMTTPNLTCFEPEAVGNLVEGMEFHKFYFVSGLHDSSRLKNTTLVNPYVHLLGDDAACIAYVRLVQFIDKTGCPQTNNSEETRVWHKRDGNWLCVHFHRSGAPSVVAK